MCVWHLKSRPEFNLMMFSISERLIFLPSHCVYEIQFFWEVTVIVTVERMWWLFSFWLIIIKTFVGDSGSQTLASIRSCWRACWNTYGCLPVSDSVSLGWGLILCIFNKFQGHAKAVGPGTPLRNTVLGQWVDGIVPPSGGIVTLFGFIFSLTLCLISVSLYHFLVLFPSWVLELYLTSWLKTSEFLTILLVIVLSSFHLRFLSLFQISDSHNMTLITYMFLCSIDWHWYSLPCLHTF